MAEDARWYVIHTYSGYENAVKTSIEKFVNGRGMEDMILRMEIPVETVKEVSEKLGRGRHTTRHVELFDAGDETYIADTPGFASFEIEMMQTIDKSELQYDWWQL